jgi:hypothetical protein
MTQRKVTFDLLFHHTPHPHVPKNPNTTHKAEQAASGINTKIAVWLTRTVGTMSTAYLFVILAIIGLLAILGLLSPMVALLVAWTSQTLIQLVLLPVIMVGQNVLSRKQEIQADAQFNDVEATLHNISQVMQHLSAQDVEILKQSESIATLATAVDKLIKRVDQATGRGAA